MEGRPEGVIGNDLRPESIREECERSLRRLGLECIDLYQFHWPDWMTGTAVEESWGTMVELVEEGKVRWIGVANFDTVGISIAATRYVTWIESNPLFRSLRAAPDIRLFSWAAQRGTGVIVYSPMASGCAGGRLQP